MYTVVISTNVILFLLLNVVWFDFGSNVAINDVRALSLSTTLWQESCNSAEKTRVPIKSYCTDNMRENLIYRPQDHMQTKVEKNYEPA